MGSSIFCLSEVDSSSVGRVRGLRLSEFKFNQSPQVGSYLDFREGDQRAIHTSARSKWIRNSESRMLWCLTMPVSPLICVACQ